MIRSDAKALETRIMAKLEKFLPQSEKSQAALHRIGSLLRTEMIMNATRKNIVDTGALKNSINYEIEGTTVSVGSFGVPYAKYHEFGANLGPAGMRAMFAAMRARRAGSAKRYRDKNVVVNETLKPRPFVRPAFQSKLSQVRRILAEYGAL
jgi:HK97 gp10 family phage protein